MQHTHSRVTTATGLKRGSNVLKKILSEYIERHDKN